VAQLPVKAQDALQSGVSAAGRGRWLARGAWLLAIAEVAVVIKDHIERLSPSERRRLVEIVRTSKGRPSNLSDGERAELRKLIEQIEPQELGRNVLRRFAGLRPGR
jgi:hypothetical protein